jgi:DNA-binding CsgD family transcriptional regulator
MGLALDDRLVARILDHAHSSSSAVAFRLQVLDDLRRATGCDGALYRPGSHWAGSTTHYLDEGSRFTDEYGKHADRYAPQMARWCELSHGDQAFVDSDLYPLSAQRRMAIYSEVVHPEGLRSMMGCPLSVRGQVVGLIFLLRRGFGSRFETDAAARITPLLRGIAIAEIAVKTTTAPPPAPADAQLESFCEAFGSLSKREREIATLLAQALQSKEIANLLGTSLHTVRHQTLRIYQKLGLRGRALVAVAMQRAGLLAPPVFKAAGGE